MRGGCSEGGDRELVDTGYTWEMWQVWWIHGLSQGQMDGKGIENLFNGEKTDEVGRDFTGRLVTNGMLRMDSQTN